jgi:pimeloyl-ACP methyl ester carboxylesterase
MKKTAYQLAGWGLNLWSLFDLKGAGQAAFDLFCRTPKPVLREKELRFLETARQVRSTVDTCDVVEYHWGPETGPLILLSYGWGYNAGRWRHFVPALETAGFHVVAYDPPGHGLNDKAHSLHLAANSRIAGALMERYGPVYGVLGHSFGGVGTLVAAERMPVSHRPERMVIMASFSSSEQVFSHYRRRLGLRTAVYQTMRRIMEKEAGGPLRQYDIARLSGHLDTVQALLVHDPADPVTPFSHALRYHTFWRGSALLRAEDGGGHHLGKVEITTAILQFLMKGKVPEGAILQPRPLPADHDLVRYFAGMEVSG